jgi:hypothetical protein
VYNKREREEIEIVVFIIFYFFFENWPKNFKDNIFRYIYLCVYRNANIYLYVVFSLLL